MACPCIRSTPETVGCGGQSRRSSTAARRFGRSGALAAAGEAGLGRSAHSKIPTRPRRRSARSHSCWHRRSTDRHANQSDRPAARTHSRTPDPACKRVRDRVRVAFGTRPAIRLSVCRSPARSSHRARRCGRQARVPGDRLELDARANIHRSRGEVSAARMGGRAPAIEPPKGKCAATPW